MTNDPTSPPNVAPTQSANAASGQNGLAVTAAVLLGVIAIAGVLALTFLVDRVDEFQQNVLWAVLAFGIAGVAVILPGVFQVELPSLAKAGGALGVFLLVYTQSPAGQSAIEVIWPKGDAKVSAEEFLDRIDSRDVHLAYGSLATWARDRYPIAEFEELLKAQRMPLGDVAQRTPAGSNAAENPPGWPPGAYRIFGWKTDFVSFPEQPYFEQVILGSDGGAWKVFSYTIVPVPAMAGK